MIIGGGAQVKLHANQRTVRFMILNWACRPYNYIFEDPNSYSSARMYHTEGKLGYEVMHYNSGQQLNYFFSRGSKKLLLKASNKCTYDQEGKFVKTNIVSFEEFVKTIRWYDNNNVRFEIVKSFTGGAHCLCVFNVLQKFTAKMVKMDTIYKLFPFLKGVIFQKFMILPKISMLVFFNESQQEVFTISLKAESVSQMKYHKFPFQFLVNRGFSKRHGVFCIKIRGANEHIIYQICEDGRLKAACPG